MSSGVNPRISFVSLVSRNYVAEVHKHPKFALLSHFFLLGGFVFLSILSSLGVAVVFYVVLATSNFIAIYIAVKFSSKEVTDQTKSLDQRVKAVTDQTKALDQRVKAVTDQTTRSEQRLDAISLNQTGRSRSASPVMPLEDISALVNEVSPKIGLSLNSNQVNYLSGRVLAIDEKIRGRIACPVQTQVLRNMCCLSLDNDTLNVLEIGTLFGGAVVSMFDATHGHFSETHFTMVDPLDGYYQNGADPLTGVPVNESVLRANMITGGVAPENYLLIKGKSEEQDSVERASSQEYDLLLIDGDHGYEGVRADFINYVPLVKKGGLVLMDDYGNKSWPDVKKFLDNELKISPHIEVVTAMFDTAVLRVKEKIRFD